MSFLHKQILGRQINQPENVEAINARILDLSIFLPADVSAESWKKKNIFSRHDIMLDECP